MGAPHPRDGAAAPGLRQLRHLHLVFSHSIFGRCPRGPRKELKCTTRLHPMVHIGPDTIADPHHYVNLLVCSFFTSGEHPVNIRGPPHQWLGSRPGASGAAESGQAGEMVRDVAFGGGGGRLPAVVKGAAQEGAHGGGRQAAQRAPLQPPVLAAHVQQAGHRGFPHLLRRLLPLRRARGQLSGRPPSAPPATGEWCRMCDAASCRTPRAVLGAGRDEDWQIIQCYPAARYSDACKGQLLRVCLHLSHQSV